MKKLISFLLLLCACARADVVTGLVQQITGEWYPGVRVSFSNDNPSASVVGSAFIGGNPKFSTVGTNGWFSNSLVRGHYTVRVGEVRRDTVPIQIIGDGGTYDVWSLIATNLGQTNSPFQPRLVLQTNGTVLSSNVTTINFRTGLTGSVSGTTATLGVSVQGGSGGSATNAIADTYVNNTSLGTGQTSLEMTNGSNTTITARTANGRTTYAVNAPAAQSTNGFVDARITNGLPDVRLTNGLASKGYVDDATTALTNYADTLAATITDDELSFNDLLNQVTDINNMTNLWLLSTNGIGSGLTIVPSATNKPTLTLSNVIGTTATNHLEIIGTNGSSAFGANGGLHIGGKTMVGASNLTVEGAVTIGQGVSIGAGSSFVTTGRGSLKHQGSGATTLFDQTASDFASMLQFGGTSSSFPGIGRSNRNLWIGGADATTASGYSLGIGTNNPQATLHVGGGVRVEGGQTNTGTVKAGGYQSSDGTAGATATTGGATFKDGLYTGGAISSGGNSNGVAILNTNGTAAGINLTTIGVSNTLDLVWTGYSNSSAVTLTATAQNTSGSGNLVRSNAPSLNNSTLSGGVNVTGSGIMDVSVSQGAQVDHGLGFDEPIYAYGSWKDSANNRLVFFNDGTGETSSRITMHSATTATVQNDGKISDFTSSNITVVNPTANRALAINSHGDLTNTATTLTELGYLNGVSSAIQGQLNGKQAVTSLVTNTVWIDAGAMRPYGGIVSDGGRNGATAGSYTNAGVTCDTWDFDDTTNECVIFSMAMGRGFSGIVSMNLQWFTTNTLNGASNVLWEVASTPLRSNDVIGAAFTWKTNLTDRFWSSNTLQVTTMPTLTMTNYAPRNRFEFRVSRLGTNTTDEAVGDVRLLGVEMSVVQTNYQGGF